MSPVMNRVEPTIAHVDLATADRSPADFEGRNPPLSRTGRPACAAVLSSSPSGGGAVPSPSMVTPSERSDGVKMKRRPTRRRDERAPAGAVRLRRAPSPISDPGHAGAERLDALQRRARVAAELDVAQHGGLFAEKRCRQGALCVAEQGGVSVPLTRPDEPSYPLWGDMVMRGCRRKSAASLRFRVSGHCGVLRFSSLRQLVALFSSVLAQIDQDHQGRRPAPRRCRFEILPS